MATNRFQAPDDALMQAIKTVGMPQSNRAPGPLGWPALSMASGAVTPAFQSGPMQPRAAVESFDLGGGGAPSRTMVTGDRSLTRNPGGMAGLPLAPTGQLSPMGDRIGSRGMTPERRMEMLNRRAYTQGDAKTLMQTTGALLNIAQQQQGMNYGRERDATNFQQGLQMYGIQQQDQAQRDAINFQQSQQMQNAAQQAQANRDAQQWQQALTLQGLSTGERAMAAERERLQREQDRQRVPIMGTVPIPGTNYVGTYADGRPMGNLPTPQAPAPPSVEMLPVPGSNLRVPMLGGKRVPDLPMFQETPLDAPPADGVGPVRPGTKINPVTQAQPPRIQSVLEGDVKTNVQWNPEKNRWERVKIYNPGDPDDNGIPGDQRSSAPVKAPNGRTVSPFVAAFGSP